VPPAVTQEGVGELTHAEGWAIMAVQLLPQGRRWMLGLPPHQTWQCAERDSPCPGPGVEPIRDIVSAASAHRQRMIWGAYARPKSNRHLHSGLCWDVVCL
jgi:hypothetical protein